MKCTFVLWLSLCASTLSFGQQWVEKKYDVEKLSNVTYGAATDFTGNMDTLKMDVFLPECEAPGLHPLLVWIHGGAFLAGDKNDGSIQDLCQQFARRGYVTASIDYRLGFVSDNALWQCNYPNYSCVFATDSAEWIRACYRAIQDAKGAVRYLVNRHQEYGIDPQHVFVAGESAGAFTALGVGLLDTLPEKPAAAYAIPDAPLPHPNALACQYNIGQNFPVGSIPRPDLGSIDGTIEPSTTAFTIRGIGNIYGATMSDVLRLHKAGVPLPAIYSFHQPCDIVVPIDSGFVYSGLSWCLANCYNCWGIANNRVQLYGSRTISQWNTQHGYGYNILNNFTNVNFPYNCLFGQGSCLDQVNNPCHSYDNKTLRENNLAQFFATQISLFDTCDNASGVEESLSQSGNFILFPNPARQTARIRSVAPRGQRVTAVFTDLYGRPLLSRTFSDDDSTPIDLSALPKGFYQVKIAAAEGIVGVLKLVVE